MLSRRKTPPLAVAAVALLVVGGLALAVLWPQSGHVVEWTEADLEATAVDHDDAPSELTTARHEIEPEPGQPSSWTEGTTDAAQILTLRGRVVDALAQPIASATVSLELRGTDRERMRKPMTTATDGTFAFRGPLRPRQAVSVLAMHAEYAPSLVDREVPAAGDEKELALGDIVLGRGATVRGSVILAGGSPATGADVQLSWESGSRVLWSTPIRERMQARAADGTGTFMFTHVPPGGFRIVAVAPRRIAAMSDSFLVAEAAQVTVPPIVLQPGCLLTGTVTDRRGKAIEKATVTVTHLERAGPQLRAVTDASGSFELDNLPPLPSNVRVYARGFVTQARPIDLGSQQDIQVALEDGLRLAGRVRDAGTGAPIGAFAAQARRVRSLHSQVPAEFAEKPRAELEAVDAQRSPIVGHQANVLPQDPGAIAAHEGGEFVFDDLDEGVYAVDVKASDFLMARSAEVELRLGAPSPRIEVDLQRGVVLRGFVTRRAAGAGIAQARVEVMWLPQDTVEDRRLRGPSIASTITEGDGRFELKNVRPGRCALRAFATGYEATIGEPLIVTTDRDGFRLELAAQAALRGHVRGIESGRESEVTVVAFATYRNIATGRVTADGAYRLADLKPDGYHVRAYLADSRTAIRRLAEALRQELVGGPDVVLEAGDERELDLDLVVVPIGDLRGVVRVNGAPGSGHQIRLVSETGALREPARFVPTMQQQIEADGSFAFRAVEAGRYELAVVSIARDRIELRRQPIAVLPGVTTTVAVDVAVASLVGEVVAPEDGQPVDGMIRLQPRELAELPPSEAPQDRREIAARVRGGRFRVDVLPVGSFTVEHSLGTERKSVRRELDLAPGEQKKLVIVAGEKL